MSHSGRLAALIVAATAFVVGAGAAAAGGGSNIATATPIALGQQEFGNTTTGDYHGGGASYWKVSLIAGDRLTVDWESQEGSNGLSDAPTFSVIQLGKTDFNLYTCDGNTYARCTAADFEQQANLKGEAVFSPTRTGLYTVFFEVSDSSYGGPFYFVATVKHRVVLSMQHVAAIRTNGSVAVNAQDPDGNPLNGGVNITLYGYWSGAWHPLGTRQPVSGQARFTLALPRRLRGTSIRLRAIGGGGSYLAYTSRSYVFGVH